MGKAVITRHDTVGAPNGPCPICGEGRVYPLRAIASQALPVTYTLYRCESCASQSINAQEHQHDLASYYSNKAIDEAIPVAFTESSYWREEVRLISDIFGRPPASVLDVGCRGGDFLMHWPNELVRVGVELAEVYAETAQRRGLTVIQGFLEDSEFDRQFDVVSCYAILEHLEQPGRFLNRLSNTVAPGGVLAVLIPSFETAYVRLAQAVGAKWFMYNPPEHLRFYSRQFLDAFLKTKGFTLRRRKFTTGGMIRPFHQIRGLRGAARLLLASVERMRIVNQSPVFDHMYSYYVRHSL